MQKKLFILFIILPAILQSQELQNLNHHRFDQYTNKERVYLHTDKTVYISGEEIYFAAYLHGSDSTNLLKQTTPLYVDLLDMNGQRLNKCVIELENGMGSGSMTLPHSTGLSKLVLQAFTGYMRNFDQALFFNTTIYIISPSLRGEKISIDRSVTVPEELSIHPEGQHLIAGASCRVVLLSHSHPELPTLYKGKLSSYSGELIDTFTSDSSGLAELTFTPIEGDQYYVEINEVAKKIPLPDVENTGAALHLSSTQNGAMQVNIAKSQNEKEPHLLICRADNQILWSKKLTPETTELIIDSTDLLPGLNHLSLWSTQGNLLSKRLHFQQPDPIYIDIDANKPSMDRVVLNLDVYNPAGESIAGTVSVAILPTHFQDFEVYKPSIENYFMLAFFGTGVAGVDLSNRSAREVDRLMISRQILHPSTTDLKPAQKKNFHIENGLSLSGQIFYKRKPWQGSGVLYPINNSLALKGFNCDENGRFVVSGLQYVDTTDIILFASPDKTSKMDPTPGKITLKPNQKMTYIIDSMDWEIGDISATYKPPSLKFANSTIPESSLPSLGGMTIVDLETVEVTAERQKASVEYHRPTMQYHQPNDRIFVDEIGGASGSLSLVELLKGRVKNMIVSQEEGKPTFILRGRSTGMSKNVSMSNGARFMVNGHPVSDAHALSLNVIDIAFVDVVSSLSELSLYGELGTNGLIMIYLKTPEERMKNKSRLETVLFTYPFIGYKQSRPFKSMASQHQGSQNSTYFWKEKVLINAYGSANIEFPLNHSISEVTIVIQGISANSQPISTIQTIKIQ